MPSRASDPLRDSETPMVSVDGTAPPVACGSSPFDPQAAPAPSSAPTTRTPSTRLTAQPPLLACPHPLLRPHTRQSVLASPTATVTHRGEPADGGSQAGRCTASQRVPALVATT